MALTLRAFTPQSESRPHRAPVNAIPWRLGGAIGGTGPLTMAPRGGNATLHTAVWTLGAASDYSGNTIMKNNDGLLDATFKLGVANALPATTSLNLLGTIANGAAADFITLDLNGNPQTLAGLTDTGSSQGNAGGTIGKRVINSGALATLTINNSGADTYGTTGTQVLAGTLGGTTAGGAAANNLALVKTGTGTLILSGANTYSGATTISTGELIGNTAGSCASSAVTVSSGATNGVQLAATDGQWTCGGLTYNAGTTYADFDFTATAPSTTVAPLKISGNLAVNATVNVIVRRGSALTAGTSYPLITWTGTGPANLNGFGTVTLPAAMPGTLQLSGSTISVMAGIKVPNLAYTNATGTSRQITVADIVTAGLTSSQGSPTYTISLPSGTSTGGGSVTTDGSQILYQPSGSPSSDSFNYTVSDGTATATATVNITFQNQASGSNPQLTVSGGAVSGTLYGIPGQQYDIQRKTNLTDTVWETLGSPPLTNVPPYITADSAGRITFSDTNPPPSSGYYRTIQH
jgi:autotransporter-associated beta strand protein